MAIAPLPGSIGVGAAGPTPVELARSAGGSAVAAQAEVAPQGPHDTDLRRLEALAAQSGLRVQVETLPQSNLTMIHLIDSPTGYVTGEFPPEGVAQAVAELEAQAMSSSRPSGLDQRA